MRKTAEEKVKPTASREILVVGLNPAFQSTLHFDDFAPGKVNRAVRKCNSVGGKGQNFAIACSQYGERDKVTVFQATGGMTGQYISAYLDELKIEHYTIDLQKTTRICTTVLDRKSGSMTELIEPAGRVSIKEKEMIEEAVKKLIRNSKNLEGIALCGTLPPGLNGSIYDYISDLKPKGCVVLIDAYQNVECLKNGNVEILKINAEESRKLANVEYYVID